MLHLFKRIIHLISLVPVMCRPCSGVWQGRVLWCSSGVWPLGLLCCVPEREPPPNLPSSCSHNLPNLQGGGGLYSQNVPLLQGNRGGDGLLGASPCLLPPPPAPGGGLGSELGGGGSLMGSGEGGGGLLGAGPDMQACYEDSGNTPGSVLGMLPCLAREGVEACWGGC